MLVTIGNSLISKLKPKDKPYDVRDDRLTGFILRVNISGKLLYMCEFARGKRVTLRKVGVLTSAQARDLAREVLATAAKGIDPRYVEKPVNKQLTLQKYILNEYAPWLTSNAKTGKKLIANNLLPFVKLHGEKLLTEINSWYIEKWRIQRIEQGVKAATVNKNLAILRAALSKAVEWRFLDKNPLEKLKPLKVDIIAKIRFLTEDEHIKLKQALDDREEKN